MCVDLGGTAILLRRVRADCDVYQILLVANKFQTGFDQSLLCGIYVEKRLAGIQAVQTLSGRLNRAYSGKDRTYVLDCVKDTAEVLAAFKTYPTTAALSATTAPNLVFNLHSKLDGLTGASTSPLMSYEIWRRTNHEIGTAQPMTVMEKSFQFWTLSQPSDTPYC